MATMTMPRHVGWVDPWARSASEKKAKTAALEAPKSSLMHGIASLGALLGVALLAVIVPAAGPPSGEASQLIQAQEVQQLAHNWVAAHPEDAVPTGDPRAWGFEGPEQGACASSAC